MYFDGKGVKKIIKRLPRYLIRLATGMRAATAI